MKVVLAAGAAIEVALGRGQAERLAAILAEADVVLAPESFVPEVVKTIAEYHQVERFSLDACNRAFESALALVDARVSSKEVYAEAFLLARTAHRPAYDMFYLALARREDAVFLTLDKTLRKQAEHQGVRVA